MLTTEFAAAVRRQGSIPSSVVIADVLEWGDGEIRSVFIPLLESLQQNYFVRTVDASPDSRGKVQIPSRAIGATLRNVQLFDGSTWRSLPQRSMEDGDYSGGPGACAYYLDAGSIVLLPTGSSGSLRIRYTARPGRMVDATALTACARITAVTPGAVTTALTLSGVYTGSTTIDILSAGPAHQQKALDTLFSSPNVPTADLQEALAVGDYIAAADTTPFVPLPEELTGALVHRTAGVILRARGYDEEASQQLSLAQQAIDASRDMLMPRNKGNPQVVRGGLRRSLGLSGSRGRWR